MGLFSLEFGHARKLSLHFAEALPSEADDLLGRDGRDRLDSLLQRHASLVMHGGWRWRVSRRRDNVLLRDDDARTDLVRLLTLLTNAGVKVPKYVRRADQLNVYAVESRYPGLSGPVTHRQWRTAVGIAEKIVRWANRQI